MHTRGIEASKYPQEEKTIVMPLVTASESGTEQTEFVCESKQRCGVGAFLNSSGLNFSGKRSLRE